MLHAQSKFFSITYTLFYSCSTDYPGEFDFQIDFGELTDYAPKSAQYTVSWLCLNIINKIEPLLKNVHIKQLRKQYSYESN